MPRKHPVLGILLAGFLVMAPRAAAAEPMPRPSDDARAEAGVHYNRGKEAAARGKRLDAEGEVDQAKREYLTAAKEFDAAYQLVRDPNALWGACRAYQLSDDLPTALQRYAEYMSLPNLAPADRSEAKTRVDEITTILIQRAAHEKKADRPAPANPTHKPADIPPKKDNKPPVAKVEPPKRAPASKPPEPDLAKGTNMPPPVIASKDSASGFGAWPWLVLGGGLAAGAVGVLIYLDGESDWDAASSGTLFMDEAVAAQNSGSSKHQVGTGLMIGGGALVATSILLFILDGGEDEPVAGSTVRFTPFIDGNNTGLTLSGDF